MSSNPIDSAMDIIKNNVFIWLILGVDEIDEEYQNTLDQLQTLMNDVNMFRNTEECVDFLTNLEDASTFLILEETVAQEIMPLIHDIPQLDQVFGFSNNKSPSCEWIKEWPKIKGIYGTSTLLCRAIEFAIKQRNQNSIAISFVSVNENDLNSNLDQLQPSFMYTQIFKEILLEMKYDDNSLHEFITLCQSTTNKDISPNNIALLKKEYHNKTAIWWYSAPSFIFSMLNHALRTLQTDIIIKMGFFLSRLHDEIQQLHQKQLCADDATSFTVYRGQALGEKDFEQLQKTRNGLMSFNNFLSTSTDENIARLYAESNSTQPGMIGVLFRMSIDSSLSSIPFADICQVSYFQTEEEVLFSMHTIFRIIDIKLIDSDGRLYQVDLQLTSDDDEELRILTKYIANHIGSGTGWGRLANLLLRMGYLDKAEELYNILLKQTSNDSDKIHYYNQLFNIKDDQNDSLAAASYVRQIAEIGKKILPADDPFLVTSHSNIDLIGCKTDECTGTLVFYKKSSEIEEENTSMNDHSSTTDCSSIDTVADNIKQSKESFYIKALEAFERTLASDQSSLLIPLNNITETFENMTEDSQKLLFNEKLLEIRQKYLPPNHPDLAVSYHNLGDMYQTRGEYSKALFFHQQSLKALKEILPGNHPYLAMACYHIAWVYRNMKVYSTAFLFYEKAIQIYQRTLPPNHPALETSYRSMASLYHDMKEYPKALEFYKKVLEIVQETLPPKHPALAILYTNIARIHEEMAENLEALSFHEQALAIHQETLPLNHLDWATTYNNIGSVYYKMEDYPKALEFHRKALEIGQEILPPNHLSLATFYTDVALAHSKTAKYSEALSFHEKALAIYEEILPPKHPDLAASFNNIGSAYYKMEDYPKALDFHRKALEIGQESYRSNYPALATCYHNVGSAYYHLEKFSEALFHFERALDLFEISVPPNDFRRQSIKTNIETVKKELQS